MGSARVETVGGIFKLTELSATTGAQAGGGDAIKSAVNGSYDFELRGSSSDGTAQETVRRFWSTLLPLLAPHWFY